MASARARQAGRLRQYFGHKCAHKFAKKIHRYIYFTVIAMEILYWVFF
jgi:hypothetical protein